MNDFILVHACDDYCNYNPIIIRISNIKSVETEIRNGCSRRYIYTNRETYYQVKESIEEIFKMLENGRN